jgi:hypothetical protein
MVAPITFDRMINLTFAARPGTGHGLNSGDDPL